jgi:hypothetical protein
LVKKRKVTPSIFLIKQNDARHKIIEGLDNPLIKPNIASHKIRKGGSIWQKKIRSNSKNCKMQQPDLKRSRHRTRVIMRFFLKN